MAMLLMGVTVMFRSGSTTNARRTTHPLRRAGSRRRPLFLGAAVAMVAVFFVGLMVVPAKADQNRALSVPSNNWDYIYIGTEYFHDVLARDTAGDLWVYAGDDHGGWIKPRFKMGEGWNAMTAIVGPGQFQSEYTDDLLARDANGDL